MAKCDFGIKATSEILNKMTAASANIGPNISNSLSATTTYGWDKDSCDCQGNITIPYKKVVARPDYLDSIVNANLYEAAIKIVDKYTQPAAYTPERIIYNNPATVVFWKDGTKTVVKKAKGEKFNKYYAFCAALAKKMYENNSRVNKIVNSGVDQTAKKKKAKKANG